MKKDFDLTPEPIDKMVQPVKNVTFTKIQLTFIIFIAFVCTFLVAKSLLI